MKNVGGFLGVAGVMEEKIKREEGPE